MKFTHYSGKIKKRTHGDIAMYYALIGLVAITLFNLILLYGVIRRLREHSEKLASVGQSGVSPGKLIKASGESVGNFTAMSVDGTKFDNASLESQATVGFFLSDCAPCKELMPSFIERASSAKSGPQNFYAVLVGDSWESETFYSALRDSATITLASYEDSVVKAFGVEGFPAVCTVNGGVIEENVSSVLLSDDQKV